MDGQQNNPNMDVKSDGSAGPIIGIIVILAIIILGGLYFWSQRADNDATSIDQTIEVIDTQSQSDDTSSIEADLESTDVDNLDSELNAS